MLDFEDPRKAALMMMAAGLLSPVRSKGASGFGEALSQGLRGGLLGYNEASQNKRRSEVMAQQAAMQKLQMDRLQQERDFENAAFKPGVGAQPLTPFDDEGNAMPSPAPRFDLNAGAAVSPRLAFEWQQRLNKQEAPITLKAGEAAFDPRTGQRRFDNPAQQKPTETFEMLSPEEATRLGIPKGQAAQRSTLTGKVSAVGSMPQSTTINMPPQERAVLKADEDILGQMTQAAQFSRMFANYANVINTALKGAGGGGLVKIGADTAKFLGLQNDTVKANDLAEALNTRLAVQVRAPGSGSTSNIEFESYKAAVPSLKNSEEGRALMARTALRFAQRDAKLADYARSLIRSGQFSLEKVQEYDDKLGSVLGEDAKKFSASPGVIDFSQLPRR